MNNDEAKLCFGIIICLVLLMWFQSHQFRAMSDIMTRDNVRLKRANFELSNNIVELNEKLERAEKKQKIVYALPTLKGLGEPK